VKAQNKHIFPLRLTTKKPSEFEWVFLFYRIRFYILEITEKACLKKIEDLKEKEKKS
jgi:hypothetical protein